jgi:hypothetical protein
MPIIHVAKRFTLQMQCIDAEGKPAEGEPLKLDFTPGDWEVTEEIANHWFVLPHTVGYIEPGPIRGTPQYAEQALKAQQAARQTVGVQKLGQPAAPIPPEVVPADSHPQVASRSGMVSEGAHYFAGRPQEDKPIPGSGIALLGQQQVGIAQSGPPPPMPPVSAQPQPTEIPPFGFHARPVVPQVE